MQAFTGCLLHVSSPPIIVCTLLTMPLCSLSLSGFGCRAIADLGDLDYLHYVCIEPGRVSPETAWAKHHHHPSSEDGGSAGRVGLPPGKTFTLTQEVLLGFE